MLEMIFTKSVIKYGLPLLVALVFISVWISWDRSRLKNAGKEAVDKVEVEALKENKKDADNLNNQKDAIDSNPSLVDFVLPLPAIKADNREDGQISIEIGDKTNASANSKNVRRLEENYKLGAGSELPTADLFPRNGAELLPKINSPYLIPCVEDWALNPATGERERGCY